MNIDQTKPFRPDRSQEFIIVPGSNEINLSKLVGLNARTAWFQEIIFTVLFVVNDNLKGLGKKIRWPSVSIKELKPREIPSRFIRMNLAVCGSYLFNPLIVPTQRFFLLS